MVVEWLGSYLNCGFCIYLYYDHSCANEMLFLNKNVKFYLVFFVWLTLKLQVLYSVHKFSI